jgi:hypothetical protein
MVDIMMIKNSMYSHNFSLILSFTQKDAYPQESKRNSTLSGAGHLPDGSAVAEEFRKINPDVRIDISAERERNQMHSIIWLTLGWYPVRFTGKN